MVGVEGFLVSTNLFVRCYNNTPVFTGSLAGIAVLVIGTQYFLYLEKEKVKQTNLMGSTQRIRLSAGYFP